MIEVGVGTNMVIEGEFRLGCIWFECDPMRGWRDKGLARNSSTWYEEKEWSGETLDERAKSGDVEGKTRGQGKVSWMPAISRIARQGWAFIL